jgi:hypothetical protein
LREGDGGVGGDGQVSSQASDERDVLNAGHGYATRDALLRRRDIIILQQQDN